MKYYALVDRDDYLDGPIGIFTSFEDAERLAFELAVTEELPHFKIVEVPFFATFAAALSTFESWGRFSNESD